jgi:hypothetical protein
MIFYIIHEFYHYSYSARGYLNEFKEYTEKRLLEESGCNTISSLDGLIGQVSAEDIGEIRKEIEGLVSKIVNTVHDIPANLIALSYLIQVGLYLINKNKNYYSVVRNVLKKMFSELNLSNEVSDVILTSPRTIKIILSSYLKNIARERGVKDSKLEEFLEEVEKYLEDPFKLELHVAIAKIVDYFIENDLTSVKRKITKLCKMLKRVRK